MKKSKMILLVGLVCSLVGSVCAFTACGEKDHTHTWSDEWTITTEPTLTTGGKAKHSCTENDGEETVDIPALSDSSVWTKDDSKSTPASHTAKGSDTYTSVYGEVTVETDMAAHTWGAWSWVEGKEPSLTAAGKAEHSCTEDDGGYESVDVPALTNTSVWAKDEENSVTPTHTSTGNDVYVSKYGTVNVPLSKTSEHTWGPWSWVGGTKPTEEAGAQATRSCTANDDGVETVDVPALTDSKVWTKSEDPATGTKTYTSEYGTVTVEAEPAEESVFSGMTYFSVIVDLSLADRKELNREISVATNWSAAQLTLDKNGEGEGKAAPFKNNTKIVFGEPDEKTGKFTITFISGTWADSDDGRVFTPAEPESTQEVVAFYDPDTKYVFMADQLQSFGSFNILIPIADKQEDASLRENFKLSSWGTGASDFRIAISFKANETTTHHFFVRGDFFDGDAVYFVDDFVDADGASVAANEAYNHDYLFVKKGGETLFSFGYNTAKSEMVELDDFYGEYTVTEGDTLSLSGYGTFTWGDKEGTYDIVEDVENQVELYVKEGDTIIEYHVATITGETYTSEKPMVTVTYNEGVTPQQKEYNKNVPVALETPTNSDETKEFRGWYTDSVTMDEDTAAELVDGKYTPKEDVTLYARWETKLHVVVDLNGEDDVDSTLENQTLYLAEGDDLLEAIQAKNYLETNAYNKDKTYQFLGEWYLKNEKGENPLHEGMPMEAATDGQTVYAKWYKVEAYVGEYEGANLFSSASGDTVSSSYHISIDINGNITGKFTGTVKSYQGQLITWSDSSNNLRYFIFDKRTGALATANYSGATTEWISNDMGFYTKSGIQKFVHHAFNTPNPKEPGTSQNYYARFVMLKDQTKAEKPDVIALIYGNHIYSNITVTNAFGEELTSIDAIFDSKTVIILNKDNDNAVVLAKASRADKLSSADNTDDLGALYGTYKAAEGLTYETKDDLKLDGAKGLKWGELTGRYVEIDATHIGAYVTLTDEDVESYFEFTLTTGGNKTYSTTGKCMVKLTLDYNDVAVDSSWNNKDVNKNIEIVLPIPTDETHVFRGWFEDEACEAKPITPDEEGNYHFKPTAETTTLYAKWLEKVTLTIHYNGGREEDEEGDTTADKTIEYAKGETAEVARPRKANASFEGWYTDNEAFTHAWGEMDGETFVTSAAMTQNVDIYAKWGDAPIYSGTYKLYYYDSSAAIGATDNGDLSTNVVIDEVGHVPTVSGATYPFGNNELQVKEYSAEDGTIVFNRVSSTSNFNAYIDSATKIMVFICRGTDPTGYSDILVLVPVSMAEGTTVTGAQWSSGTIRVINIHKDDTNIGIYLESGKTPFIGVTFTDFKGVSITDLSKGHQAPSLYVKKTDEVVARWGYNNTTMVQLDGTEGEYSISGNTVDELPTTLKVDGHGGVTFGEDKVGTYEKLGDNLIGITVGEESKKAYYEATLNKEADTYTIVKPMLTVEFTSEQGFGYGEGDTWEGSKSLNKKIEIVVPKLNDTDTHVFRGWFTDQDFENALPTDEDGNYLYTPQREGEHLYAKWLEKVTVTVIYQKENPNGVTEADKTIVLGKGEEAHPVEPEFTDGQVFKEWHLDSADGSVWKSGTKVEQDITIYCVWMDANILYGSWSGKNVWSNSSGNGDSNLTLTVTASGDVSGKFNGAFESYDPITGRVIFNISGGGHYYGSYDAVNDILILNDGNSSVGVEFEIKNDIDVFLKHSFTVSNSWGINNSNKNRILTIDGTNNVLVYNERVYGNVTFKDKKGSSLNASELKDGTYFTVYSSEDSYIVGFMKDDSEWIVTDGLDGTYTGNKGEQSNQDLVLDGKGGVSWAGRHGTYVLQEESENVLDVYLEADGDNSAEYWVVTITQSEGNNTYTAEQPMVTLTLILRNEEGTQTLDTVTKSVNKNIPIALSETHEELVSGGWYNEETLATPVEMNEQGLYVPTETATLYAKMVGKVTLTIKYGTEHGNLSDATVTVAKGETPDLFKFIPAKQADSYVFGGWYEDEACETTPYVNGPLTANKTIYCKWIEQQYDLELMNITGNNGDWVDMGGGVYRIEAKNGNNRAAIKITFKAAGTFTFDWTCKIFSNDSSVSNNFAYQVNPSNLEMIWFNGKLKKESDASGTGETVTVQENDILYIVFSVFSRNDSDYVEVSNFDFVAD